MNTSSNTQAYDTLFDGEYQVCLPLDREVNIPKKDPVRILNTIFERMDWTVFDKCYSRKGRAEYSPRILTKILVYGYMRKIYSSREIEAACRENIKFMYLLEGQGVPDHNTIARFRSKYLREVKDQLMKELVEILIKMGEIDMADVFIDGTKIEANANRYSFVWKKNVLRYRKQIEEKMRKELPGLVKRAGVRFQMRETVKVHHLKKLRKRIGAKRKSEKIEFVKGAGHRKSALQKLWEKVEEWLKKLKEYNHSEHILGDRNSYSKTDHDATFMRMKEDHMGNGQLKPGYNINVASCGEYIIGSYVSSDRTDTKTLIPFMERLKPWGIKRVTVDAGYESEENYCYFEQPDIKTRLLVKPSNYEQKKKKKYKQDISRRENMTYDAQSDTYVCANGRQLSVSAVKHTKSASGFPIETTVYTCASCQGCPLKEKCIRGKSKVPMDERNKSLYVSKRFLQQRERTEVFINTSLGKILRTNRSIQAEGTFAMTKEDMNFRRFLLRGNAKVDAEWTLLSMAYNILKLFHKATTKRLGSHLVLPANYQ